jgi:hypothetical protein
MFDLHFVQLTFYMCLLERKLGTFFEQLSALLEQRSKLGEAVMKGRTIGRFCSAR